MLREHVDPKTISARLGHSSVVITLDTYSHLSELGFRRSGDHLYRPHCKQCSACIPARIPAADFTPSSGQKRIIKRNRDLQVSELKPEATDEIYALYERYINARHADGDMFPGDTIEVEISDIGTLRNYVVAEE